MRDGSRILLSTSVGLLVLAAAQDASAAGLNLNPDPRLVAAYVIVFTLLIYPVNRLLIQPLLAVIQERESRSAGRLDQAEGLRREAQATQDSIETRTTEMRAEAQAKRGAILANTGVEEQRVIEDARSKAGEAIEEVRRTVARELGEARESLAGDARGLAEEAASKILGRAL